MSNDYACVIMNTIQSQQNQLMNDMSLPRVRFTILTSFSSFIMSYTQKRFCNMTVVLVVI